MKISPAPGDQIKISTRDKLAALDLIVRAIQRAGLTDKVSMAVDQIHYEEKRMAEIKKKAARK